MGYDMRTGGLWKGSYLIIDGPARLASSVSCPNHHEAKYTSTANWCDTARIHNVPETYAHFTGGSCRCMNGRPTPYDAAKGLPK